MTWRRHPETDRFLDILIAIDLSGRYYGFCDTRPTDGLVAPTDRKADHERVLRELDIVCTYDKTERFFRHELVDGDERWVLHLQFHKGMAPSAWHATALAGSIELGLYAHTPRGDLGGAVQALAEEVALRRDPNFERTPPYPTPEYWNETEMRTAIVFARDLLHVVKHAWAER